MSRLTAIICAVVICLVVSMAWAINHYRGKAITYKDQRDKATVRAETSEAITNNVVTTMNLIRDISQATQNAKNELAKKGETRIVYRLDVRIRWVRAVCLKSTRRRMVAST